MRFRKATALICLVLMTFNVCMADKILMINKNLEVYEFDTVTKEMTKSEYDYIYLDKELVGGDDQGDDDDDTPDPPGPQDPIVKQIADVSKQHLNTEDEATALLAIVDTFSGLLESDDLTPDELVEVIGMSVRRIDREMKTNGRVKSWFEAVIEIADEQLSVEYLGKVKQGLSAAFGLNADRIVKQVIAGRLAMAMGDAPKAAAESVTNNTAEAIDLTLILTIIQAIMDIIELFRGLGQYIPDAETINQIIDHLPYPTREIRRLIRRRKETCS